MKQMLHNVLRIISNKLRRLHFFETIVSLFALWWFLELTFINPGVFTLSPSLSVLRELASAKTWGIIAGLVWVTQFFGMYYNKSFFRRVGHLMGVGYWITIAATIMFTEVKGTGVGTYFLIGVMCAYLYWKVGEQK